MNKNKSYSWQPWPHWWQFLKRRRFIRAMNNITPGKRVAAKYTLFTDDFVSTEWIKINKNKTH